MKVDGKAPNIFSVHAIANKWMGKSLNRRIGQNVLRIKKGVPIPLEKVYGQTIVDPQAGETRR